MAAQLEEGKDSGMPAGALQPGDDAVESKTTAVNDSMEQENVNGRPAEQPEKIEGPTTNKSDANRDKPVSAAEEITPGMLPSDPEDESAIVGTDGASEHTPGLGSILKGSPFETENAKNKPFPPAAQSVAPTKPTAPTNQIPKPTLKGNKANANSAAANGKPRGASEPKSGAQATRVSTVNGKPEGAGSRSNDVPRGPVAKTKAQEPKDITPTAVQTHSQPPKPASLAGNDSKLVRLGQTNGINHGKGPSAQSPTEKDNKNHTKTVHPKKLAMETEAERAAAKSKESAAKQSGRPSEAAKAPVASKPSNAKPSTQANPSSPPGFAKPKPKPPTRPVKLPASATASTAASAAKVDGAQLPSRSPSRISNSSMPNKARVSSQPKTKPEQVRPKQFNNVSKPARASLPAGSRPSDKPKVKPRMSMASAKAPEGSFLDRMMRPTQSSASKTHEKVEAKSPPRKAAGAKPNRRGDHPVKDKPTDHVEEEKPEQSTSNGLENPEIPAAGESI